MMALSVKQKRINQEKFARMEAHRRAVKRNKEEERRERVQKAEYNHIPSILFLAKEAELRNIKEAVYWYEKAAYQGNATGMYGVVRLCSRYDGDVVMVEKVRFWKRYIKGVEGDMDALFETGKALISGLGIAVDKELGIKVVEQSATSHHVGAINYMGDWCLSDESSSGKKEDSSYWYAKAARLNSSEGMMKLGLNYVKGRGIEQDHKRGCFWLESAAELGDNKAMYHAGKAWIDMGQQGNAIAYIWLYLASQFNYGPAKALRDEVASKLGVDSLVLLQGFANPLLKKLQSGTISRHIIVRALNRLYKRGVPIISGPEINDDNTDEAFLNQLVHPDEQVIAENSGQQSA